MAFSRASDTMCVALAGDHFDDFFIPIHFYSILIEMVCMAMRDVNDCHDLRDLVMVNTLWFT